MKVPLLTYLYEQPRPTGCAPNGSVLDTLPFFLEHYRQLGVSRFLIVLNTHGSVDLEQRVARFCPPARVISEPLESKPALKHFHGLLDELRPDWYIKADLDEFHEYPFSLDEMAARMGEAGQNVVLGELIDQVSSTGEIVPVDPQRPLTEQFPIACHLTRDIVQGCCRKLMLCRGDVRPRTAGFHHAPEERLASYQGTVRHYKWHGDLLNRLEQHADSQDPFRAESRRFLDWFQSGGLRRHGHRDAHGSS